MLISTLPRCLLASSILVLAAGCDSNTPAPTTDNSQSSSDTPVISAQLAEASVANATEFSLQQEPVKFPLYDIGIDANDPRAADLVAKAGSEILPSQLIDTTADGEADTLLVTVDLAPGQTRSLTIEADAQAAATREQLPKQTQAEISHKVGGEWQEAKYIGGTFENVTQLTPPPQYTDHSEWIRYEGPGIESDKVGYRIYLDWRNGFDIFGKKTTDMVLQDVGQDGYQSYHEAADWGMDILKVGQSLGAGGYGFYNGEKVELVSKVDEHSVEIIENGPLYSAMTIDYQGWEINNQKLDLTAHLSMHAGSRLVHTQLSLSENLPNIAIGMVKHPGTELIQGNTDASGYNWTYTASWGKQSLSDEDSYLGMAIIYRISHRMEQTEDDNSYVSVMKTAGSSADQGEVEYYFLAAWDGEPDGITNKEDFITYLDQEVERLTITPRIRFESTLSREAKAEELDAQAALEWSKRLADSELERKTLSYHADGWDINRRRVPKFEYDVIGLVPMAYDELNKVAPNDAYAQVPYQTTATFVTDDGELRNYSFNSFNIDYVKPGVSVLRLYQQTGEEKYQKAAAILRHQLEEHPRTKNGAFWHKKSYPYQVWLDGVYMGMPFLAQYALMFEEGEQREHSLKEVVKEFEIAYQKLRDPETGLYFHAWDESREIDWADADTGLSPELWARGVGWYAMALVDVLDILPEDREDLRAPLLKAVEELAPALAAVQDETGTWFQILDQPERVGNYRESTATAMFSYFFAKAVRKGYLPESYKDTAVKAYNGLINEFVTVHPDGKISMTNQCLVAGLGFGRDGSYRYYMSERIFENDPKGNGPFILAGIEMHRLLKN
ncbi:MAG TPA: glycoside hydrolase family 88 protein [Cellvibrionaceae bacterium]